MPTHAEIEKQADEKARLLLLIDTEATRFFHESAKNFEANPSSDNWVTLEKAMWALQAVKTSGLPRSQIEQIVFDHPLPQWIYQLVTQHKGK